MIIARDVLLWVVKAFKMDFFFFLPRSGSNLSCSQASKLSISTQWSSLTQLIIQKKYPSLQGSIFSPPFTASHKNVRFKQLLCWTAHVWKGHKNIMNVFSRGFFFFFLLTCEIIPARFNSDLSKVGCAKEVKEELFSFLPCLVARAAIDARDRC